MTPLVLSLARPPSPCRLPSLLPDRRLPWSHALGMALHQRYNYQVMLVMRMLLLMFMIIFVGTMVMLLVMHDSLGMALYQCTTTRYTQANCTQVVNVVIKIFTLVILIVLMSVIQSPHLIIISSPPESCIFSQLVNIGVLFVTATIYIRYKQVILSLEKVKYVSHFTCIYNTRWRSTAVLTSYQVAFLFLTHSAWRQVHQISQHFCKLEHRMGWSDWALIFRKF